MNSLLKLYVETIIDNILKGSLSEAYSSNIDDTEYLYRSIGCNEQNLSKTITINDNIVHYQSFEQDDFSSLIEDNLCLSSEDGISTNRGWDINNLPTGIKIDKNFINNLNHICRTLTDNFNIDANLALLYSQNDARHLERNNTFAVARFNAGFLKKNGMDLMYAKSRANKRHVLIISTELNKKIKQKIINLLDNEGKQIDFNKQEDQNNIITFLANLIVEDVKNSTNINNDPAPFYNIQTKQIIPSKSDNIDIVNHSVLTNYFHISFENEKSFNYSVFYDNEFIIHESYSSLNSDILKALVNNSISESFESFLAHKGLLVQLYK